MIKKAKKDSRRRISFYKNMCRLRFCKYILSNQNIPLHIRVQFKNLGNLNLQNRIRNRCILTGRSRGVYRFCKLSRTILQEKALSGELNGVSKTSW